MYLSFVLLLHVHILFAPFENKHTDAQRLNWRVLQKASIATGLKIKPGKVVLIPYWSHSLISHLAFAFPSFCPRRSTMRLE